MKRLIIICEGNTEYEFCQDVLLPYFFNKKILVSSPTIKKSSDGIVKWDTLKRQIESHLKQETYAYVTTFIDLYALPSDYPNFDIHNIDMIEQSMKADIDSALNYRFIPYIQRHEFECFVFASMDVLQQNFTVQEADFSEIERVIQTYQDNLEDINNSPQTSPSKRLELSIKGYKKVIYGACLASEIGLSRIRQKCPRFSKWIEQLENL